MAESSDSLTESYLVAMMVDSWARSKDLLWVSIWAALLVALMVEKMGA